ncbi:DUF2860 family protein [Vibrio coralliilyticus]|uniref:DUF2860 family protein n=1 Tax=Vibrio coralliilyticus TaxID=190893 RepID=UPI0005128705|nr:DUF2860 family protein [Vibrio coralliilyticus]AIU66516.1 hypothetical protein JV59_29535 [Vibrio coralliilyticus]
MKIIRCLFYSTIVLSSTVHAIEESVEQGFSGEFGIFAGYSNTNSNFNTETNETITSLNQGGKSDSEAVFVPLGSLRYQFGDHQIFLGQSEDTFVRGVLAAEIGYKNQLSRDSAISISYAPTVVDAKTWQNPYALNSTRKKTDIKVDAYRLKYEFSSLTANFVYYDRKLDTETSGVSNNVDASLLNRNGDGYLGKLAYGLPISENMLIEPSLLYRKDSADGKAMAYDNMGVGITHYIMAGASTYVLDARYSQADFDAVNPLFGKTRKDDRMSINFSYEYLGVFGLQNLSLTGQLSYEKLDSNIKFYNEQDYSILVGSYFYF